MLQNLAFVRMSELVNTLSRKHNTISFLISVAIDCPERVCRYEQEDRLIGKESTFFKAIGDDLDPCSTVYCFLSLKEINSKIY